MSSESGLISYRARWIAPVTSPPIENGRIDIAEGRIVSVSRGEASAAGEIDRGDVVIVPGFINAHTHLELTWCRGRVPYRGAFTQWVRDLVALTRSDAAGATDAAIATGLRESAEAGVAAVADIGHGAEALHAWRFAPLAVCGFLEVLGMGPRGRGEHERSLAVAMSSLENAAAPRIAPSAFGISPHAPYSTAPEIYREAIAYCQRTRRPICTHLAETPAEAQFLADGTGPFRELLEEWGLWDGTFTPPGCSPVEYAHGLGLLEARPLLAHVNYASDTDLDLLTASSASVAYCPRTHRFFEHTPHRYADMLARGINVCLGTDSLASTDSLSILDELRFLRREHSPLTDSQLLHLATLAGARALGWAHELGTLEPGKRASFITLPLEHPATRAPLADVLAGSRPPLVQTG